MAASDPLRPESWETYIGQVKLKSRLQVAIGSALKRLSPMDHVLLAGGPGMGKTSLASLIAQELHAPYTSMVAPVPTNVLAKFLMEKQGVLFLDEFHRFKRSEQEWLYPIIEDGIVQTSSGKKFKIDRPITIIAATTDVEKINKPLRDRFTYRPKFDDYTDDDMALIVARMAARLNLKPTEDECYKLGIAAAGTPRQARTLVYTARDVGSCNLEQVLDIAGITPQGLTEEHLEYLGALYELGMIAGIEKISNYTGQPRDILLDLEKLLLTRKLIEYEQKGRSLTMLGLQIIKPGAVEDLLDSLT